MEKQKQSQLMKKAELATKGFSVIEVVLSAGLFALIATALAGVLIYGEESSALAGARARAIFLAEEGLEATRNIRDSSPSNLVDGNYGLLASGGSWTFSGTSDAVDIFLRQINISTAGPDRKTVTSTVTWQQNEQRQGSVVLSTRFTNWMVSAGATPSCAIYCQDNAYSDGTCRQNVSKCGQNGETYESGGDAICTTDFPGDPSHDTCCCTP